MREFFLLFFSTLFQPYSISSAVLSKHPKWDCINWIRATFIARRDEENRQRFLEEWWAEMGQMLQRIVLNVAVLAIFQRTEADTIADSCIWVSKSSQTFLVKISLWRYQDFLKQSWLVDSGVTLWMKKWKFHFYQDLLNGVLIERQVHPPFLVRFKIVV